MEEIRDQLEEMIQKQFLGILNGIIQTNESVFYENATFDDLMTSDCQLKYELKMTPVL